MRLKIMHGETIPSTIYTKKGCFDSNFHQICISNEFCPGWNASGTWYMGCIWIYGLHKLTKEEGVELLTNATKKLDGYINGDDIKTIINNIDIHIKKLINYILENSTLNDVTYGNKINIPSINCILTRNCPN